MTESNISTKEIATMDRLDEVSILLYRAIAINDLVYEATTHDVAPLRKGTLCGATDALHSILSQAKDLIDGVSHAK